MKSFSDFHSSPTPSRFKSSAQDHVLCFLPCPNNVFDLVSLFAFSHIDPSLIGCCSTTNLRADRRTIWRILFSVPYCQSRTVVYYVPTLAYLWMIWNHWYYYSIILGDQSGILARKQSEASLLSKYHGIARYTGSCLYYRLGGLYVPNRSLTVPAA